MVVLVLKALKRWQRSEWREAELDCEVIKGRKSVANNYRFGKRIGTAIVDTCTAIHGGPEKVESAGGLNFRGIQRFYGGF